MAIVTHTNRLDSVRNSCVIEVFSEVFVLSGCFLDLSVGLGALVIALSQISSFFLKFKLNFKIYVSLPFEKEQGYRFIHVDRYVGWSIGTSVSLNTQLVQPITHDGSKVKVKGHVDIHTLCN